MDDYRDFTDDELIQAMRRPVRFQHLVTTISAFDKTGLAFLFVRQAVDLRDGNHASSFSSMKRDGAWCFLRFADTNEPFGVKL